MKTREEIIASCPIGCDLDSYLHGYANGYTDGELEKPNTPEGLEEAADRFVQDRLDAAGHPGWNWETRDVSDAFIAGAEWQKQHDAELIEIAYNDGITIGMTKQKEQMMKEAVEGRVFMSFAPGHNQMVMADVDLPTNTNVRVIVLPKECEK